MNPQMMRVISSPSISTTGVFTLILAMPQFPCRPPVPDHRHCARGWEVPEHANRTPRGQARLAHGLPAFGTEGSMRASGLEGLDLFE